METIPRSNEVFLCGTPLGEPLYSHSARAESFYTLPFAVARLSGTVDTLDLTLREPLLVALRGAGRLAVRGELRSFNSRSGIWPRLILSVFVRDLEAAQGEDDNLVRLRGALCKPPRLRRTPMGRDICDLILAVNRSYGRSDYLPCICWGELARETAALGVGTQLALEGRLQSRRYRKLTEEALVERTAYEVSVARAETL